LGATAFPALKLRFRKSDVACRVAFSYLLSVERGCAP
jgi:hypothetical protein